MLNKSLAVGIILLFLISLITPMAFGYNDESSVSNDNENNIFEISTLSSGPMDSPWPMKCHDIHHTGRSLYSTADNPGIEKWRYKCGEITGWVDGGIVIGDDGTLYFGDSSYYLYALNPDGTLNWEYRTGGAITSTPAIGEDGTIYVGSWDNCLHAVHPNGTRNWKFKVGIAGDVSSSPAIAEDGTIYFGIMLPLNQIVALNSNGTEKWRYQTGEAILSDPAIGDDGTIYIGSIDGYLYAMNPNGTLKWRFKTGDYVKGHPSIADDGTIYIGSWDDYLYALYSNGTMKWKYKTGGWISSNPSIGSDGTIYVGSDKFYAIYPNGVLKWSFEFGSEIRFIRYSSPAISADGTIYVGVNLGYDSNSNGGEIIAINPDGTEKWRKRIANYRVDSSPCIGEDGTVYIGSTYDQGRGYLHAFGSVESNSPPETPTISGPTNGKPLELYSYKFASVDPDNNPVTLYIDWGDFTLTQTLDLASGEVEELFHIYISRGSYTIRVKARDVMGEESDWGYLEVSMPKNKIINPFLLFLERIIERFPTLERILQPVYDKLA